MLTITVPAIEMYDEAKNEFVTYKSQTLVLEHSLVSISKWESKWNKSFFRKEEKTIEEIEDYVQCMTITQNVDPEVYKRLSRANVEAITRYIDAPMTATTFNSLKESNNKEVVTSELIYYWMIANNVPMECQKWHINRLITLLRVCDVKNTPPKKMSRSDTMRRYASLNAARKKQLNTKG